MQLDPHVQALQHDLAEIARLGDDATAEASRRLAVALEPALRLRLLDVLTDLAGELSSQMSSGHVEVRLAGRDPQIVVVDREPEPEPAPAADDALTARITLRLPEGLKAAVEAAAALTGLSVNAWLVRALARAIDQPRSSGGSGPGRRLSGY